MAPEKPIRVLFLEGEAEDRWKALEDYLSSTRFLQVEGHPGDRLPAVLDPFAMLLLQSPARLSPADQDRLKEFICRGGGCLAFVDPSADSLPSLFGVRPGPAHPPMELRFRFTDQDHPIARRLPPELSLFSSFQPLHSLDDFCQALLTTTWHFQREALALVREEGEGRIGCTSLQAPADPLYHQLIYRLIRHLADLAEPPPIGVGVVGYGPLGSVGYLHGLAVREIPGLNLLAFCDQSPERLFQCREDFPECRDYGSVQDLARDSEIDLVLVATPPNTHADLAIQLLGEGKHVVCEKPMCLTRGEAEAMIQAAEENRRLLSSYQNRRWDPDFVAIRQALQEGLVGDPFYLETFVGDYRHPCHYWHSHLPVSGDAMFDWGAHYVDWILNLFAGPTAYVGGTLHKRVWHDVTNADQMRAHILFADGREAQFLYSDIAALRKPKWYLLGTEGAIVGEWREISVGAKHPVTYYQEDAIPVTEASPSLTLRRRHPSGTMVTQDLPLPNPPRFPYHLNLADHLLTGEPLAVSAPSALRVVAVLEAATRSAQRGGVWEEIRV